MIADRVAKLRARVRERGGDAVIIVGVTKRHPESACVELAEAGIHDLGENYVAELARKAEALIDHVPPIRWHVIGGLQTNKVRGLVPVAPVLIQSVDRASLIAEIARRLPGSAILIQVDGTGLEQRSGCGWDEIDGLVAAGRAAGLSVQGLMTVAGQRAVVGDAAVAAHFGRVRRTADSLALPVCSMGMSEDLDLALDAGSTMIRVGSALLGPRP